MSMNREIKFRAWHKAEKHFLTQMELRDPLHVPVVPFETTFRLDDKHVVFQQFTGLKDKNGKEIYEGDVVRILDHEGKPADSKSYYGGSIWQVYWRHMEWHLMNENGGWDNGDYYHGDDVYWDILEVIGNIYENPELLSPSTNA